MKNKRLILFILLAICVNFLGLCFVDNHKVYAQTNSSTSVLNNDDKLLSTTYLDLYSVPTSFFTYSNNGGELTNNELSKAFDRNFNTCFKSSQDNNVAYIENGETKNNFINYIDICFNQNVEIDRLLYGTENSGTTRGYPTKLNLYYYSNSEWILIDKFITSETSKMVLFDFGQTIATTKFRFEYEKVSTNHKYVATAREIILLQPEVFYDQFSTIFSNYAQTKVSENFNTIEKIETFENQVKNNINYETGFKKVLVRAKQIVYGSINFDARREFSTNQSANNVIKQNGNVVSYVRNVLKMNSFGTNRQVSGLYAKSGESFTVYVEADEGEPLPRIQFSQNYGHWSKWLSSELQLTRGKNTFVVPNFKNNNYTIETLDGGAVYIINPYTNSEQNSSVKIYFESGEFYPVYRKGEDEIVFKNQLNDYYEKLKNNSETMLDICEIVTDHIIFSATASGAYVAYQQYSPATTVTNWDNYLEQLLNFGGVDFDQTSPYYNQLNEVINVNIRIVQPYAGAGAYAASEHVGVYKSWENLGFYASGFGWGMSHEIGHMTDIPERTLGETTNNMYSKYNEAVIEKVATRGYFSETLNALSSDLVDTSGYFNSNRYNYLIWWYIECYQKGFWGNLEKCYRGQNANLLNLLDDAQFQTSYASLNKTEKNVFLSSLVTGIDLTYYFERWGFNLVTTENIFNKTSASNNFNICMSKAENLGYISSALQPKLWYQDASQYSFTDASLYCSSDNCTIKKVFKTENSVTICLNTVSHKNHLGYEILQGNDTDGYKVIGFTYTNSFVDTNSYPSDYVPSYKVRAIDRQFNATNLSESLSYETTLNNVCVIDDTYFSSISEAVKFAKNGDTIILLNNTYETNIIINKNITITLNSSQNESLSINKMGLGHLFTIEKGNTLTITGLESNKIIISGNDLSQNGSLFAVIGSLNASFITLTNSLNLGNGGAILMQGGSLNLSSSTIQNCSANLGGAIYCDYPASRITLQAVEINNCSSTSSGSAIASKGTITLNDCLIKNCNAGQNGTIYNYAGGILYLNNSTISSNTASYGAGVYLDGYTELNNSTIKNNSAKNLGGAIYYSTSVAVRKVKISDCVIEQNSIENKNDIYIKSGTMEFLNSTTIVANNIYIGGNLNIDNSCDIKSQLSIESGGNLTVLNGIFTNYSECIIKPINPQSNTILVSAYNYNLSQNDANNLKLDSQFLDKNLSENKIYLVPKNITLTIETNSQNIVKNYNYGEKVILNFTLNQNKYISSFIDENLNITYLLNDEIILTKNTTLKGIEKDKIKVTLMDETTNIYYILPYEKFTLPEKTSTQKRLKFWTSDNASFSPNDNIYLYQDTTFTAVYEQLFKVTFVDSNKQILDEIYTSYASEIELPKVDKDNFEGWKNGNNIANNTITVYADITLTATYKQTNTLVVLLMIIGLIMIVSLILFKQSRRNKRKRIRV